MIFRNFLVLLLFLLIGCGDTKNERSVLTQLSKQSRLVNQAPQGFDETLNVQAGKHCFSKLNATDIDGDEVIFSLQEKPKKGTLFLKPNGAYVYVAKEGMSGEDSFTFCACDALSKSSPATVTIMIDESAREKAPQKVKNLKVTWIESSSAKITWDDMSDDEENFIIMDKNADFLQVVDKDKEAVVITGLEDCNCYSFLVASSNSAGYAGYESVHLPKSKSKVLPAAPLNISVSAKDDTSLRLVWDDVDNERGYALYAQGIDRPIKTVKSNFTTMVLTGLEKGKSYNLKLSPIGYNWTTKNGIDVLVSLDDETLSSQLVASIALPGYAKAIAISKDNTKVYVANGSFGLQIIDVNKSSEAKVISTVDTIGYAKSVTLSADNTKAFIADGDAGVTIIDIEDASNAKIIKRVELDNSWDIALSLDGEKAYVADGSSGIKQLDISDINNPSILNSIPTVDFAQGVTLSLDGSKAYVADAKGGLQIIDTQKGVIIGSLKTKSSAWAVILSKDETKVFMADFDAGLIIIDVANPTSPKLITSVDTPGYAQSLVLSKDESKVFIADWNGGLQIIDVSDVARARILQQVDDVAYAEGLVLSSDETKAYVAAWNAGLKILHLK